MACPFKYINNVVSYKITKRKKLGIFKYVDEVVDEEKITETLCRLNHFVCVGEEVCPIMRR